ncbi:MAG: SOS response-associated peptidase [Spirochaetia bacterium]|jgi:putative SOS response-associated peptidase YedK|nr:SOS response-associated peptidase [Spirochaetia bacterium]
MCFNIAIAKTAQQIASFYGINQAQIPPLPEYYAVSGFSSPEIPILYRSQSFLPDASPEKRVDLMRWGLIPSWIKTSRDADGIIKKTLNARSETLSRLPSFRGSYRTKRCVVITDGFYEPHHIEKQSFPFFIRKKDRGILSLAGLYALWSEPENPQHIYTFTIITTEANELLSKIHNQKKRMPVILPDDTGSIERWLDPGLPPDAIDEFLKKPGELEQLEAFPVSKVIYKREGSNTLLSQHPMRYPGFEEELDF